MTILFPVDFPGSWLKVAALTPWKEVCFQFNQGNASHNIFSQLRSIFWALPPCQTAVNCKQMLLAMCAHFTSILTWLLSVYDPPLIAWRSTEVWRERLSFRNTFTPPFCSPWLAYLREVFHCSGSEHTHSEVEKRCKNHVGNTQVSIYRFLLVSMPLACRLTKNVAHLAFTGLWDLQLDSPAWEYSWVRLLS